MEQETTNTISKVPGGATLGNSGGAGGGDDSLS